MSVRPILKIGLLTLFFKRIKSHTNSMRVLLFLVLMYLCVPFVHAQVFRVPAKFGRAIFTGPEMVTLEKLGTEVTKKVYAANRAHFKGPKFLLKQMPHSLVQISLPGHDRVWGSGFLIKHQNDLYAVMAYHLGGKKGSLRTVRLYDKKGQTHEYAVTIEASGNAGWHEGDIALARLPQEANSLEIEPLSLGTGTVPGEAYSFGYCGGDLSATDFLPMNRYIYTREGVGIQGTRQPLQGEDPLHPFLISGYCGSPILQEQEGAWKVVGVHVGGEVVPGNPEYTRSFAVDVTRVVPFLIDQIRKPWAVEISRGLYFRGYSVTRLSTAERVKEVHVLRGDGEENGVYQQALRNYDGPYSDERSELALGGKLAEAGDIIRYFIYNQTLRQTRVVDFVVP